jgi:hypothetical protein
MPQLIRRSPKGCPSLLVIVHPRKVCGIHHRYGVEDLRRAALQVPDLLSFWEVFVLAISLVVIVHPRKVSLWGIVHPK